MALTVKLNGVELKNFKDASVIADIGAVTRAFSLSSTATENNLFPVVVGDIVEIAADGIDILEGFVERIQVGYSSTTHEISISGRSLLADLVDSSVSAQTEINGTTLEDIIRTVMIDLGIEPLISNQSGLPVEFNDITSAEVGQNAFEFLESFSRKRQVLLTTDGKGTIILARASEDPAAGRLRHVVGATGNNILSSNLVIDHSERFDKYTVHAQLNPSTSGAESSPQDISEQGDVAFDSEIRSTRSLEINAEESMDSFTSGNRAKWEANIRKANSLNYSATVQGHSVNGKLWQPNTLVSIQDEFAKVSAEMLIRRVQYDYSIGRGSTVKLSMTDRSAFTLVVSDTARATTIQEIGGAFTKSGISGIAFLR